MIWSSNLQLRRRIEEDDLVGEEQTQGGESGWRRTDAGWRRGRRRRIDGGK